MKELESICLRLIEKERNIYELAELYNQNRAKVEDYIHYLKDPYGDEELNLEGNVLRGNGEYNIKDDIIFFHNDETYTTEWKKLNKQFLNYHKSLSVYTLINSIPGINYLSSKSGLGELKNKRVLDVGGGTGHTFATFFKYSETIDYFLLDPNVRLLHDHFIRLYPELITLKMKHIVGQAEYLPFKSKTFDVLLNVSAIDHLDDYKKFISEAYRVLKPGGKILIASHLDIPLPKANRTTIKEKIFNYSFFERIARYLYFRRYAVGNDDHTLHIESQDIIVKEMESAGFSIQMNEVYKRNFFIVGVHS